MTSYLIIAGLSIFFAIIEYIHHREYNSKHSDQEPCGSGVIGYLIIIAAVIGIYFGGKN